MRWAIVVDDYGYEFLCPQDKREEAEEYLDATAMGSLIVRKPKWLIESGLLKLTFELPEIAGAPVVIGQAGD